MADRVRVSLKDFLGDFVNQYSALVGSSFERLAWKNNVAAKASITKMDIHSGSTWAFPSLVTIKAGNTVYIIDKIIMATPWIDNFFHDESLIPLLINSITPRAMNG